MKGKVPDGSKNRNTAKSGKRPSLITAVKFSSPSLLPKKSSATSSTVQFYKSPAVATPHAKDETSLGSLLKKMKQVQSPATKQETRDEIIQKMQALFKLGARRGSEFVLGFNSINRLLESRSNEGKPISVICMAGDVKGELIHCLGQAAALQNIPFLLIPKFSKKLQELFQVKSASCFALRSEDSSVVEAQGGLDDFREYLTRLAHHSYRPKNSLS